MFSQNELDKLEPLKKYWTLETIENLLSNAMDMTDINDYMCDKEDSSIEIFDIILSDDEWFKKNPTYSFYVACLKVKEKHKLEFKEEKPERLSAPRPSRVLEDSVSFGSLLGSGGTGGYATLSGTTSNYTLTADSSGSPTWTSRLTVS